MADYLIDKGVQITADPIILSPVAKLADAEWFDEDVTIVLSAPNVIAAIVVDFSYSAPGIAEYTLDSGTTWVSFNNGLSITGGQSRFIRVTDGDQVNFRSKVPGNINRCIVSIP